jgi:hypothetical protein
MTNQGITMKPVSELSLQELALVLARHEYPNTEFRTVTYKGQFYVCFNDGRRSFSINWPDIGPLWERENGNYYLYLCKKAALETVDKLEQTMIAFRRVAIDSGKPESIARALVGMWYPTGIPTQEGGEGVNRGGGAGGE